MATLRLLFRLALPLALLLTHSTEATYIAARYNTRWADHRLPIVVGENVTESERAAIAQVAAHFNDNTCIVIEEKSEDDDQDYVIIEESNTYDSCSGSWGYRMTKGFFRTTEGGGCYDFPVITSWFLYNLGALPEHSRPDRDSYIKVNWANIDIGHNTRKFFKYQQDGANNEGFEACEWFPATGSSHDHCAVSYNMDTFGLPYDYRSVTHYGRRQFASDPAVDTITPIQVRGAGLGNNRLSFLDVLKLETAYDCPLSAFNAPKCGGYNVQGPTGTLDGSGVDNECRWLLSAPPGKQIMVEFHQFSFSDCTDTLTIRESTLHFPEPYCSTNVPPPVQIIKTGEALIELSRCNPQNKFYATWRFIDQRSSDSCCEQLELTAVDPASPIATEDQTSSLLGHYEKTGDLTYDEFKHPIFRQTDNDPFWLAHEDNPTQADSGHPWVLHSDPDEPGSLDGPIQLGPRGLQCPTDYSEAFVYHAEDEPLEDVTDQLRLTCLDECSDPPPTPAGTTLVNGSSLTTNSVYSFQCDSDPTFVVRSVCLAGSTWSSSAAQCPQSPGCTADGSTVATPAGGIEVLDHKEDVHTLTADSPCVYIQSSRDYPDTSYKRDKVYVWAFTATCPTIVVSFLDFDVAGDPENLCNPDYVRIQMGEKKLGRLCGSSTPEDITFSNLSSKPSKIVFVSGDDGVQGRGFKASVCMTCDRRAK